MLRTSTRNLAYEVISCLIDDKGHGVLTDIIKFLTSVNKSFVLETGTSSFLDGIQRKKSAFGKRNHFNQPPSSNLNSNGALVALGRGLDSEEDTESYVGGGPIVTGTGGAKHRFQPYFPQKNSSSPGGQGLQSEHSMRLKLRIQSQEKQTPVSSSNYEQA